MDQCTFKPEINSKSEFYARRSRGCFIEPLAERLHHEGDKRMTLRHKAKELMEADAMCEYTFQPQINQRSRSVENRAPIHVRTQELKKRREQQLSAKQAQEERRSECSFQPKISGRSERIVQKKRDAMYRSVSQGDRSCLKFLGPVEERLYAEAQAKEQRLAQNMTSVGDGGSQCSQLMDEESRRICRSSVYFQGPQQDFLTRQQTFELAKQKRMEVRSNHAEAVCSFKPEISGTSRQMVSNNLEYVGETPEERVDRLAVKDVERRDKVRDALEQLHYRDCTFRPAVNPMSQRIARDDMSDCSADVTPVHERLYRPSSNNKSRSTDDARMDECTFKPAMDAKSMKRFGHVRPSYDSSGTRVMENIRDAQDRREEQLMTRRLEVGEQERQECTFTPGTHRPYEEPSCPVVVSGLDRFFELKEMASKRQRELHDRHLKVFHPEASNTRCNGVTIPEAFNLSKRREDSQTRKASRASPVKDECTFAPRTNESANREILRQIMRSTEL